MHASLTGDAEGINSTAALKEGPKAHQPAHNSIFLQYPQELVRCHGPQVPNLLELSGNGGDRFWNSKCSIFFDLATLPHPPLGNGQRKATQTVR
jgi:hypothetical protein